MEVKKIRFGSASEVEILTDEQMRRYFGGYDGSGTYDDPYILDEIVITPKCAKIYPCLTKSYKERCDYFCNGKWLSGRCCNSGGFNQLHCSDLGDFAC